ncbi:YggS family pyridoxal phosphate-dependent enzyme [Plebeiibacterium marinum]|uniref:Pyridoxal phosphate homeostasis protein n=1 Tax=Plebeiibacterium marinum TaxID=2992111 RepID=A0AAE3SK36_9BACT|nr:YggS family pyridoxal phosphate-dependent enzyme [Plebeiobacterium marinum]MCW3806212.1 YggS family pyridoxal phosphate-dependent enzyme [Plebeiobacterium marinum]
MSISDNIKKITSSLPLNVTLVAVSKTKPNEDILEAYHAGQRVFGENKVQDLTKKWEELPKDIQWHFIGHLQTNKIKYLAPFVSLLHGVDSYKLLKAINKEAKKNNRIIKCLLQFHIAEESSKFGLSLKEAEEFLCSDDFAALKNVEICGVMGMATYTDDEIQIANEFKTLKDIFIKLKEKHFNNADSFSEISMGMSGDYPIAIEQGSTMIRVGSSIFGVRNYG